MIQTVREKFTCRSCEKITQPRCRPDPRRRCDRAGAGQKQSRDRAAVDRRFREGRLYVRDDRPFGGGNPPARHVFLFARPRRRASAPASCGLGRYPAGRRRRLSSGRPTAGPGGRVWRIGRGAAKSAAHYRSRVPGPRPAQVLCAGRSEAGATQGPLRSHWRIECRSPHRRDLRRRARDRRAECRA